MKIKSLSLEGFRNYGTASLEFDEGCNVIYGENAQGKTNLLEAIAYMSCGKSPRAHADRELIGFEKDSARLFGVIESRERKFKTDITLQKGRRRKITINGVEKLHPTSHEVIGDRIVAGTWAFAAAMTRGDVTVGGIAPRYRSRSTSHHFTCA